MADKELVDAIRQGDTEAFSLLFDRYYGEALRAAYLITGNRCDSEYVVQDAFITCYEKLSKLRDAERFRYWFFRILTRTAWKYCNKQKREQPVSEVFDSELPSHDPSSFEILAEQETASEIRQAVNALSPKQRTVVVLYYYHEFSVAEIAEIMGCTAGTVKSRLFSARKNLQKSLSQTKERSFNHA